MKRKVTVPTLCAVLFALCSYAQAQQPKKIPRIGFLSVGDVASDSARAEAIRLALGELGYIEGQNIAIEYRYGEGKRDRAPELAAELVRLKVDIIVVSAGDRWIQAAKNATKTIPIVMRGAGSDPVEAGLVESLARPGGNVTGITNTTGELGGKRLELLKEAVPKLDRVVVLPRSGHSGQCTPGERSAPRSGTRTGVDYSVFGGTSCGWLRESIRCAKQGAPRWTLRVLGPANDCQQKTDCRLCVKEPVAIGVPQEGICRCRWAHVLRGGHRGHLPARSYLCGQNPKGSQACRSAGGAANEVRTGDQSQDGEADRRDDSAQRAGADGQDKAA